jgi:hypothetical protein
LVAIIEPRTVGDFRLTVLNPGGRDPQQDFSPGIDSGDKAHPPINFHAYAACTAGTFRRETKRAAADGLPVLLLLRSDFKETLKALIELKRRNRSVVVSLKETGLHQIAKQLSDPRRASRFYEIVAKADNCLAATPEALSFYGRGEFIPTPYPLHDLAWNFSRSLGERRGIFVGTREWDVPSRNHLAAMVLALQLGEPVTVFDQNAARSRQFLSALGLPIGSLRVLRKRLLYREYLAEMARHKIVLQADRSAVPGQVAGDALLCRMPCVGGDGAVDRLAFPSTCGFGRSLGELRELASRLLCDADFYTATVEESQRQASAKLGFDVVARQLADCFTPLLR